MRQYQLTKRGRQMAKQPTLAREPILDQLYPKKLCTLEELEAVAGKQDTSAKLRAFIKKGWIEEVGADGFPD